MSSDPATHAAGLSYPCHPQAAMPFSPQAFQLVPDPNSAGGLAQLKATLDKLLGPEFISQRPGPGSGTKKLSYIEGWKVINLANEIFGFNGWTSSITSLTVDYIDHNTDKQAFSVGVTAIVRVTLRDGAFHEDVGYGTAENVKQKGAALDKCKKEAVTDGVKRALRNFGNVLGNCLYDQSLANEILKVPVPRVPKFVKSNLYRRPEFAEKSSGETAPKEGSNIPAPANNQISAPSDAQHIPRPANNAPNALKPGPPASISTRRPESTSSSTMPPVANQSLESSRPQTNPSVPIRPRSHSTTTSNRASSISRRAAIEAAMAEHTLAPEPPTVPPRSPSPLVRELEPSKSMSSFGSEDDMLYGDIDLNLECYDSMVLEGDVTLVNDTAPVPPNETTEKPPPLDKPSIQAQTHSRPSSNGPQSRLNPSHLPSTDPAKPALTVHPRNVFNSAVGVKPPWSRPVVQEFSGGKKRNSDEMNDLMKRTAPTFGGFTTAGLPSLQPGQLGTERSAQTITGTDNGNDSKRGRR